MERTLGKLLESIGNEIHDSGYTDANGVIRSITKDEQLAREIWRRALGYEQEITNADGSIQHRIFPPDPKIQQFLIERREGKIIQPTEEKSITLLEKISELAKAQLNKAAEEVVKDGKNSI